MATDDLASMSDQEFMDAWTQTGNEAQALKERLREFSAEHQRRSTRDEAQRRLGVDSMTEDERAAYIDALQSATPVGIESDEAVNTDG